MKLHQTLIAAALLSIGFAAQAATEQSTTTSDSTGISTVEYEVLAREATSRGRGRDDKPGHRVTEDNAEPMQLAREAESRGRGRGRDDKPGHRVTEDNAEQMQLAREATSRGRGRDDKPGHRVTEDNAEQMQLAREGSSRGRGRDGRIG